MYYVKPDAYLISICDEGALCLSMDVEDINGWTEEEEWN